VYDFSRITVADTIHHLQYVAKQEGITASEEALNVVAQKADGGMRDALSIFDQLVSFCGTQISYEQAIEVLNVLDTDYYFRLVNAALVGNVSEALLLLNEVLTKGFDAGNFVTGFAQHLRDVLVSKDAATVQLLETSDAIRQHYQEQAQRCAAKWLFNALDIMNTCDINYRTAKNKRLSVELALVKLCRLTEVPVQEVQRVQNTGVQAATPAAQPAPRPVTATQPTAVPQPAVTPKPATPTAPPPPKPTSLGAMPSLGNLGKLSTTPQAAAQPTAATPAAEQPKRNSPFTFDQLKSAWVGQIKHFEKEERFKAMLTTYELVQDSETKFHITVDNQLQKKEFAKFGKQLMDRVRDVLQNDDVQLRVEVAEYTAAQVAYTSTEKYKILNQLNPHLEEMRQRMNLQIE
jgi:DNA polymerase-3 subunit gamma/tau